MWEIYWENVFKWVVKDNPLWRRDVWKSETWSWERSNDEEYVHPGEKEKMPQREDSMSETPRQERVWHAQKNGRRPKWSECGQQRRKTSERWRVKSRQGLDHSVVYRPWEILIIAGWVRAHLGYVLKAECQNNNNNNYQNILSVCYMPGTMLNTL